MGEGNGTREGYGPAGWVETLEAVQNREIHGGGVGWVRTRVSPPSDTESTADPLQITRSIQGTRSTERALAVGRSALCSVGAVSDRRRARAALCSGGAVFGRRCVRAALCPMGVQTGCGNGAVFGVRRVFAGEATLGLKR